MLAIIAVTLLCAPAWAQLEENLAAFSEANAEGYLKPLQTGFGQILNSSFFTNAAVPERGLHVRFDLKAMSVLYSDDDETFRATTEGDFSPATTVDAPTAVGSSEAVTVQGTGNTVFVFPGGFELSSLTGGVPQLTVGSVAGTEAAIRFLSVSSGDAEIGDITFFGIGVQHSLNRYLKDFPLDLAGVFTYQSLDVGDNVLDSRAYSFGVRGGHRLPRLRLFGGLTYDWITMDAEYDVTDGDEEETIHVDMSRESSLHASLGLEIPLGPVFLYGSGELAQHLGVTTGLGFGF